MENNNELQEYLKNKNCRGCSNRCPLHDPACGRSKVFIEEEIEKYNKKMLENISKRL